MNPSSPSADPGPPGPEQPSTSALKYLELSRTLAQRIRAGLYDETGLPGERDLAAEFDVARITVRNALHALEERGMIVRRERRGTLAISGAGAPRPRRLLREVVDQFLDRGRIDQRRVLAFGWVAAGAEVADALGLMPGERVLRVARVRSIDAQRLTYTEAFVPRRIGQKVRRQALEKKPYLKVLETQGVQIGDAEQVFAAESASPLVAEVLGVAPGSPVLRMRRIVYDTDGEPLQFLDGWYRSDHFDVAMRMSRGDDATRVWLRAR